MCVCERERKRGRDRETDRQTDRQTESFRCFWPFLKTTIINNTLKQSDVTSDACVLYLFCIVWHRARVSDLLAIGPGIVGVSQRQVRIAQSL